MFNKDAEDRISKSVRRTEQIPAIFGRPRGQNRPIENVPYHDYVYLTAGPVSGYYKGYLCPYAGLSGVPAKGYTIVDDAFVLRTDVPVLVRSPSYQPLPLNTPLWGRHAPVTAGVGTTSGIYGTYIVDDPQTVVSELCTLDDGTNAYDWTSGSCQQLVSGNTSLVPASGGNFTGPVTFVSGSSLTINQGSTLTVGGTTTYIQTAVLNLQSGSNIYVSGSVISLNQAALNVYNTTLALTSGSLINVNQATLNTTSNTNIYVSGSTLNLNQAIINDVSGKITGSGTTVILNQAIINDVSGKYTNSGTTYYLTGTSVNLLQGTVTASGSTINLDNCLLNFTDGTLSGKITSGMLVSGLLAGISSTPASGSVTSGMLASGLLANLGPVLQKFSGLTSFTRVNVFNFVNSGGCVGSVGIKNTSGVNSADVVFTTYNFFGTSGENVITLNPSLQTSFLFTDQTDTGLVVPPYSRVGIDIKSSVSGSDTGYSIYYNSIR